MVPDPSMVFVNPEFEGSDIDISSVLKVLQSSHSG